MDEELKGMLENAAKGVEELRATHTALQKKYDGLDQDKINRIGEDASKSLENIQQLNARHEAATKAAEEAAERMDKLEKMITRGVLNSNPSANAAATNAYYKSLGPVIRNEGGAVLDVEAAQKNLLEICALQLPNLDEKALDQAREVMRKSLVSGSGPDGGYWVPVQTLSMMIKRIFETSPMRQLARTITTGTNSVEIPIDDGEWVANWGNELSVPQNEDTPQIGVLTIPVHNLFARGLITQNMLEDATIDPVAWLSDKAVDKFSRTENTAFLRGDGVNKPRGPLSYEASADVDDYERGKIGVLQAAGATLGGDDFIILMNHLKEAYQANANFLIKRITWANVATLKDNQGQYLMRFGDQLSKGVPATILGRSVYFADDMDTVGSSTFPVAFGDFRAGYLIVDRVGMSVLRDPYSQDPLIRYRFRKRVGGAMVNFEAIKLLQMPA